MRRAIGAQAGIPEDRRLHGPHGGGFGHLYLDGAKLGEARRRARDAKSWDLTPRQL